MVEARLRHVGAGDQQVDAEVADPPIVEKHERFGQQALAGSAAVALPAQVADLLLRLRHPLSQAGSNDGCAVTAQAAVCCVVDSRDARRGREWLAHHRDITRSDQEGHR